MVIRFDLQYSGNFFATPRISEGVAAAIVKQVAAEVLPRGYRVKMIGRTEEFEKTAGYMLFAFVATIVLYGAGEPVQRLPPALRHHGGPAVGSGRGTGGIVADRQEPKHVFLSLMGLVLLMGLVAKNSILLVDLTNQLRVRGQGEALMNACPVRLQPVLMTSLTVDHHDAAGSPGTGGGQ